MAIFMAMLKSLFGMKKGKYTEADLPPFFFSTDHRGRMVVTTDRGKTWRPVVDNL